MPTNLTASANHTAQLSATNYNFPALVFGILLIIVIICGNLLVCLSVYREKALKTTTNYFIVSLAVADLLLAVLVLPLFVYAEFQDGVWSLNMTVCDGLMTMDVMLCTASIFNLCAISIDRFIAVSIPLNYNRKHVDQRQIVLLSATWILALAVASPVLFGINDVPNRDHSECKLENNNYVVYSSVCSFFVPCPIMLLLYCGIFQGLRRWEEVRKAKLKSSTQQACHQLEEPPASLPPLASLPPPLPPVIQNDFTDLNLKEMDQDPVPDGPYTIECKNGPVASLTFSDSGYNQDQNQEKKRAKINRRERKAMRVLPVVVGAFLFCWTPFFVVHTMRALCQDCDIPSSLISIVTWLGYVNSAINPVIYTVFNTEFRKFFRNFLPKCC
ncbi:dopamine receptor D4a [Neoarius graeffei]|uniref:dopamine receptor D4a n=1 Tax=Neoarius graeffei TaxID=443677 RepID=UPI00298D29D7|nr:dopamine receptor D4a [Neoarius graeffei]